MVPIYTFVNAPEQCAVTLIGFEKRPTALNGYWELEPIISFRQHHFVDCHFVAKSL